MACSIDYLRNKYKGETLKTLANHHYQIKDELANSKLFRKDSEGILHYFKDKLVPEAITKIGSINARYKAYIPNGTKIVRMDSNGLKINISPIADMVLAENDAEEKYKAEKHVQNMNQLEEIFLYEGSKEADKEKSTEEAEEDLKEGRGIFSNIISDLEKKITTLKESLADKPYAKNYSERIKELEDVIKNKDDLSVISNYIVLSSAHLKAAKKEFNKIKEKYKNKDNLTQKEVLDFTERLNEIREFLHFYAELGQIKNILKENDITLQEESKEAIKEVIEMFTNDDINQAIDETDLTSISSVEALYTKLASLGSSQSEIADVKLIITNIDKKGLTTDKKLQDAIDNQTAIVTELQDYSVNLTADWLFPYLDQTNKKLEAKGFKDDVVTKKQLVLLLKKARKDVGFFARNLGATISNEDPVTALVAVALKDLIYLAQRDTNNTIYTLTDLFAQKNIKGKEVDNYHDKYLRKAKVKWYKVDADGKRSYSDEKGNSYYTNINAFHEALFHDKYDGNYDIFKIDLKSKLDLDEASFAENPVLFMETNRAYRIAVHFDHEVTTEQYQEAWIDAFISKKRSDEIGKWHLVHSAIREDKITYIDEKFENMSDKRFENWLRTNARVVEDKEYTDRGGNTYTKKDKDLENNRVIPDKYTSKINLKKGEYLVYAGNFTVPNNKLYANTTPEYLAIKDDPYYQALYRSYKESNDNYVYGKRLPYGIIPQIPKDLSLKEKYLDDENKPDAKKLKNHLKNSWIAEDNEIDIKHLDENGEEKITKGTRVKQQVDGTIVRNIPVRHTALFDDQSKVNTNLLETVTMFVSSANAYKAFSTIEPNIEVLKTVINGDTALKLKSRSVLEENSKGNPVVSFLAKGIPTHLLKEKSIRLNEMLTEFIDDVVYGEDEEQVSINLFGTDWSLNKTASNLMAITSLYSMAGNVTSGINNLILGNINSFSESIGGRYYTRDDWWKANKEYWREVASGTFFKDLAENNWNKKSIYTQLQVHFDAVQGELIDTRGKVLTSSTANKLISKDTLFFNQHVTEHEIQMKSMIAMLRGYKIGTVLNELNQPIEVSLFNAYEKGPTGKMQIKEIYKKLVTPQVEQDFRNQLHAINKRHHGNYNKFDKSSLQRKWYGKLALMFRKYLYTSFKTRLGSKQVDYEIGDITEGYYSVSSKVAVRFFGRMLEDIKANREWMVKKHLTEGLTKEEEYALKKTAAELSFLVVAQILIVGLTALDLDDDDDLGNYARLQAKRIQQDLLTFLPPASFTVIMRLFSNPSATFNVVEKANDFLIQMFSDPFAEYKRKTGFAEKGDSKAWVKLQKLLPGWRQYINLTTSSEQLKYYDLIQGTSKK